MRKRNKKTGERINRWIYRHASPLSSKKISREKQERAEKTAPNRPPEKKRETTKQNKSIKVAREKNK